MEFQELLNSHSETTVVYRYLDMLAERTTQLEQQIELHEIRRLRLENQQLREQLATSHKPGLPSLISYLPIFYRNFWSTVSPEDIAVLANTSVPELPAIISEPSPAIISEMRKRFLQLPITERLQFIQFCKSLPYQLQIRPSMRELLEKQPS